MTNEEMTNEEAIHILNKINNCCNSYVVEEAITMSIKALELTQTGLLKDCESCRAELPCTDAINRQAAIDCITYDEEYTIECLKALPPVKPAEKTGRWIDTGSDQMCTRCGEIQHGYDSFRRFCASCGAKMIEPQESEVQDADSN